MDLQIEGRHTDVRPEWTADIQSRVVDLHPGHDIKHTRVTLTKHEHRKAEDSYEAVIVVQIPGHTITARKQQNSFEEAIRDAFAAMETELEKIREKRGSAEVRMTAPPEKGVISKLFRDDGYGFITIEDGTDVYFHRNAVHDMSFADLEDGMEVRLNVEAGENGPQATTVNPVASATEYYADKGSVT
ncbi:cold shock domain-containing protein [Nitrospira sp. Nam74]